MGDEITTSGRGSFLQRLRERLNLFGRQALFVCKAAARQLGPALRSVWQVAGPVLRTALQIVLALLIVLEEWGWRPLADLLGRLARWRPWARVETAIARLPPYAALFVFVVPSALLLPLKFLALFLIARGQFVLAALLFAGAKVVATALVARLFMLTQPALMQIGWFAWGYATIMPWKEALVERVRASWVWRVSRLWKERAKRIAVAQGRAWRPAWRQLEVMIMATSRRLSAQLSRLGQEIRARWAASQR
jgi:hypothetical protein